MLFVFLFILPQRRRQRAQQQRLSSVDVGDEVLTVGGLIGRVVETDDSELRVEIADDVVVRIARRSGHTRFPLCEGDLDHVIGLVHIKDLFRRERPPTSLTEVARPIALVP